MTKIFIAQKLGVYTKELGMGIEPTPIWRHRQSNSFFAASFSFFFLVTVFLNSSRRNNFEDLCHDPDLPYKATKLKALCTRSEINDLFAKWGVKDTYWSWDPDNNEVFVQFKIVEKIDDVPKQFSAKVGAPAIWNRKTRFKA